MAGRQRGDLISLIGENGSPPRTNTPAPNSSRAPKAVSISLTVLARKMCSCNPRERAASCRLFVWGSEPGFVGLISRNTAVAVGTNSCSSSTRFAIGSAERSATPVATRPVEAGDETRMNWVEADYKDDWDYRGCCFGSEDGTWADGGNHIALTRTRSAASAGNRSY